MTPQGWSSITSIKVLASGRGRPAAIVIAVLLAIWYMLLGEPYWRYLQQAVFDAYQRVFPRQNERLRVTIVDIDEASLTALGQWGQVGVTKTRTVIGSIRPARSVRLLSERSAVPFDTSRMASIRELNSYPAVRPTKRTP